MKKIIKLFAIICVFSIMAAAIGDIQINAAEVETNEKIVRVITEKQLNRALKNPDVETIILRTNTYDFINISSKKAKNKNIIIDAPNTFVFNYSKFKSIEIQNATWYFENVSGNTITISDSIIFQVNAGAVVKEVIFKTFEPACYVQNGGNIKKIVYKHNGHESTSDSSSDRILYLDTEVSDGSKMFKVSCTYKYDAYGRLLEREIKVNDSYDEYFFQQLSYNEYGYLSRDIVFDITNKNPSIITCDIVTDSYGNTISTNYSFGNYNSYEYRTDSPFKETKSHFENDSYISDCEYFYDENDRLIKKSIIYSNIVDGVKGDEGKNDIIMSYYKNGCLKSSDHIYENGDKIHEIYKYDKSWNMIYSKSEFYSLKTGETTEYEEKCEYDEYGILIKKLCKNSGTDEWEDIT